MRHLLRLALFGAFALSARSADAECRFDPFAFFPDRNDHVRIHARSGVDQPCTMAFKEGPGYRFTDAAFLQGPPHGVLAKTGPTAFLYLPFKGYKGADSFAIKICAIVRGRGGCSSLTYDVDVR